MRVLGVDPGSQTTGWGILEGTPRKHTLVTFGVIRAQTGASFAARLMRISRALQAVIAEFNPQVCAIEEAFFALNVGTALKLGHVRGVILLAAEEANIEIVEYSPRLVKQTVAGFGNAEKYQVQEMVRILLGLKSSPQPHDASDALALAICHFHHVASPGMARATAAPFTKRKKSLRSSVVSRRNVSSGNNKPFR